MAKFGILHFMLNPPSGKLASLTATAAAIGTSRRRLADHVKAGDITPALTSAAGRQLFWLPAVHARLTELSQA